MPMSASVTVKNETGSVITITDVSKVNDDAVFKGINIGDKIENTKDETLEMSNKSLIIAPRGVGCSIRFICHSNFQIGEIYLDDPAIGRHWFSYGNQGVFAYAEANPSGNNYTITIRLVA